MEKYSASNSNAIYSTINASDFVFDYLVLGCATTLFNSAKKKFFLVLYSSIQTVAKQTKNMWREISNGIDKTPIFCYTIDPTKIPEQLTQNLFVDFKG
jgi:hypothetical protein